MVWYDWADLRWNEIGPGGAAAIVAMLQRNHCLTEIRLVGNGIPPSIQAQIDELLESNRRGKLTAAAAGPPPPLQDHDRAFPDSDNLGQVTIIFLASFTLISSFSVVKNKF